MKKHTTSNSVQTWVTAHCDVDTYFDAWWTQVCLS